MLEDQNSINLGSVYETVVAQELHAHGFPLFYYDNKKNGEVDYLIDDVDNLSVMPLEIKSGKDYKIHSALNKFLKIDEYNIKQAFVLSNEQRVFQDKGVTYMPVYFFMFFSARYRSGWQLLIESGIAVGNTYLNYVKYQCYTCDDKIENQHKNYFGHTKAALSLIHIIK